jgi:microcystin-dependent protein
MADPFIAEIKIFAGNFAPRNYAFCNGQLLPVAQNTALFSLIGTTYGGDGRTTTGLPNLQGRLPMHPGHGPGLTSRRLGEKLGAETQTLSSAQLPSHNHTARAFPSAEAASPTSGHGLGNAAMWAAPGASTPMASNTIGAAGGGQAHENNQPFLVLNFIIALVGTYPS